MFFLIKIRIEGGEMIFSVCVIYQFSKVLSKTNDAGYSILDPG